MIASLVYGRRFEYDDPQLLKLLDCLEDSLKEEAGFLRQVREASGSSRLSQLSGRQACARNGPSGRRVSKEGHWSRGISEAAPARGLAWR